MGGHLDPRHNLPLHITDEIKKEISTKKKKADKTSLLKFSPVLKISDIVKLTLSREEKEALDVLLGQLLDDGHVSQACQVAQRFGHYDQDLTIVVVSQLIFSD